MKSPLLQTLVSMLATFAGPALFAQPVGREAMPRRTPEEFMPLVQDDHRVIFKLKAPAAHDVVLKGLGTDVPLARDAGGVWSATLGPLKPDVYEYYFEVDGAHVADPKNPRVAVNANVNGPCLASELEIRGAGPAWYEMQAVPHGTVETRWYRSKDRPNPQRLHVYLPPGYDPAGTKRYPVLYLFHGGGFDDSSWTGAGRLNAILDNLIAAGEAVPMIVVMPSGGVPGGFGRNLTTMAAEMRDSILPFVEAGYRAQPDADHRAVIGFSMGGAQSLMVGLGDAGRFHWVGGMAAAIHTNSDDAVIDRALADPAALRQALKLVWLGAGEKDFLREANLALSARLEKAGVPRIWTDGPAGHTWISWRPFLRDFARRLFK